MRSSGSVGLLVSDIAEMEAEMERLLSTMATFCALRFALCALRFALRPFCVSRFALRVLRFKQKRDVVRVVSYPDPL